MIMYYDTDSVRVTYMNWDVLFHWFSDGCFRELECIITLILQKQNSRVGVYFEIDSIMSNIQE